MYQMLAAGGWVMPFIVVCSVLALAICIERHFALNKQRIAPTHLLATVWQQLRGDGLDAQRLKALRQGSPLGAILAAGLANRHQGREVMRESIREAASHVIHSLERYLNALGTIAAITPLMGLLGTVVSNASEMPPASALALPVPWVVISVNTLIMPTTVPSRPISGVIAAMVPSALR